MKDGLWTKEEIRELLKNNEQAVLKAIIVLYNRQTDLEKEFQESNVTNGIGFNRYDSYYLTGLAKQLLTEKRIRKEDFWRARWRIFKYVGQLTDIANEKIKQEKS